LQKREVFSWQGPIKSDGKSMRLDPDNGPERLDVLNADK
jgi:hypothetical protein